MVARSNRASPATEAPAAAHGGARLRRGALVIVWLVIVSFGSLGLALIIWRKTFAYWQSMFFGARMPAGCVMVEGALILLGVLAFYLLYLFGIIPLRRL